MPQVGGRGLKTGEGSDDSQSKENSCKQCNKFPVVKLTSESILLPTSRAAQPQHGRTGQSDWSDASNNEMQPESLLTSMSDNDRFTSGAPWACLVKPDRRP